MSQFKLGEWLVVCDRCGWKRFASQVTETWDGLIVCSPSVKEGCFETRHPQDFIKQIKDDSSVPFIRSRPTDVYVSGGPEFNCDASEEIQISRTFLLNLGTYTIYKASTIGPVEVTGTTITVVCTWTIN